MKFPEFRLDKRVAMVTGATGGIGRTACLAMGNVGATLALVDIDRAKLDALVSDLAQLGAHAIALRADVTSKREVDDAVAEAVAAFGGLDVLFNNAGIGQRQPFVDITEAEWDRVIAVNLKGAFLVAQAVAREMIKHKSGSIIHTASIASFIGRNNIAAYSASKAGVELLSKVMAVELAEYGIRVNTISPGMIHTPFTATFLEADSGRRMESIASTIPLKRVGVPEDMAGAILYLASDASCYTTGHTIVLDGGWTASVRTDDAGWTTVR